MVFLPIETVGRERHKDKNLKTQRARRICLEDAEKITPACHPERSETQSNVVENIP